VNDRLRCVWHPQPAGVPFCARIDRSAPKRTDGERAAIDAHWAERCAENPRLFDGPILAFAGFGDPMTVRPDTFRALAAWPGVPGAVQQLGVTGVLLASDESGVEHVLLGQRGRSTRVYGGQWELGPSGGVDPPTNTTTTEIGEDAIVAALLGEITEEIGLTLAPASVRIAGAIDDVIGGSVDVVAIATLRETVGQLRAMQDAAVADHAWEYEQTRWVRTDTVEAFDAAHGVIPPTRTIFRAFRWVPPGPL
jgi:8-oxo-dGTP pyrophosphatase MutT (NUDIX family)